MHTQKLTKLYIFKRKNLMVHELYLVVAVQHWSDCEEIPHIQEQRRSPSKKVEGEKSCLESKPIPARDGPRA